MDMNKVNKVRMNKRKIKIIGFSYKYLFGV